MNTSAGHPAKAGIRGPRQRGLTLIEVLVTVVILSVGLLGVAGLQGIAKRSTHQAYQRTMATQLVDGIIERVRANPTAAASYHTGTSNPLGDPGQQDGGSPGKGGKTQEPAETTSIACKDDVTCTPAQLAAYDLWSWEQAIEGATITETVNDTSTRTGGLINPRGCIVHTAETGKTNTGQLTVILSWEGMTDISDAVGEGGTVCGDVAANTDASRRQLVVNTYIYDKAE